MRDGTSGIAPLLGIAAYYTHPLLSPELRSATPETIYLLIFRTVIVAQ